MTCWHCYLFIQPAGYRVPRRTCSAPPTRSGGVHAVGVPTPSSAIHPTSSLQAPPPPHAPPLLTPHAPPPGPASHRLCSRPSCSWWTWQGASVSVGRAQCSRMCFEFVNVMGIFEDAQGNILTSWQAKMQNGASGIGLIEILKCC